MRKFGPDWTAMVAASTQPVGHGAYYSQSQSQTVPKVEDPRNDYSDDGLYTSDEEFASVWPPPCRQAQANRAILGPPAPVQMITHGARSISSTQTIQPWTQPIFAPLPAHIIYRLSQIRSIEMPPQEFFNLELARFVQNLPLELREVTVLSLEAYAALMHALVHSSPQSWVHVAIQSRSWD
jgi:hypothetical protein